MIAFLAASSLQAAGNDVSVAIRRGDGGAYIVLGEFRVEATQDEVWATLTDYDAMRNYVSSIDESHLKPGPIVEQTMSGTIGPFRRQIHLVLALDESPNSELDFEDVSRRSFKRYRGSWKIIPENGSMRVIYELEAVPGFYSPSVLINSAFKKGVGTLLSEVKLEIMRRASKE